MQNDFKHIHFLGIAGIGVSALAQLAQARGVRVSGSDPNAHPDHNPAIARLAAGGATLYTAHRAENVARDVDLVVASAAIGDTNPEIAIARERGIPIVSRAEFLGQLMAAHSGPKIAVAGTHGKTTTTGMIGVMLQHAGLDPTVFVGGEVRELGGNVRIGSPDGPFVAEACEAYDSFLYLKPDIAVITNIEADHLDHYGTFDNLLAGFQKFISNIPTVNRNGMVVCADDANIRRLIHENKHPIQLYTYGIDVYKQSPTARLCAYNIHLGTKSYFDWRCVGASLYWDAPIMLNVPGKHNIQNALAAAMVGLQIGVNSQAIAEGLAEFRGATRRQDVLGEGRFNAEDTESILVMDDYAHHPTEICATLDALRGAYPDRRLVAIFQPHLYSRTRDFLDGFGQSLALADDLIVTDIYAAREQPIEGVNARDILDRAVAHNPALPAVFVPDKNDIPKMLAGLARPGDVCVFMGAGDIRDQGEAFAALLHAAPGAQA